MLNDVDHLGLGQTQPHITINNDSALWASSFNHHLVRPLPHPSQAHKAPKKVSNYFYRLLHVLLTITPHTDTDEWPTPPHLTRQVWGGFPAIAGASRQ